MRTSCYLIEAINSSEGSVKQGCFISANNVSMAMRFRNLTKEFIRTKHVENTFSFCCKSKSYFENYLLAISFENILLCCC